MELPLKFYADDIDCIPLFLLQHVLIVILQI